MTIGHSVKIHSSSIVDEGAIIGNNTKIWHWVHISEDAIIGNNCSLGQNVFIGRSVVIGNNVKIQNNVSVYEKVTIEDNVFCGPSMVFTNVINPRSEITRKNEYKMTHVSQGVTFGANCTIVCGIDIGEYAFIGAGSVVTKNVKQFALIVGVPGKQIGWMSKFGERINLPLIGEGKWKCPNEGVIYTLKDKEIKILN